jgi:hypothetical protein
VYITVPVLPPVVASGVTPDTVPDVFLPLETRTPLFSTVVKYVSTTYGEADADVAKSESKSYPMNLQVPVHSVMAFLRAAGINSSVSGVGGVTSGSLRSIARASFRIGHISGSVSVAPVTHGSGVTPLILYSGVFFLSLLIYG